MMPETTTGQPMNEFNRIAGVYLEPTETFRDISKRPTWWVPMILISVFSLLLTYSFSQRVGWERLTRQSLESNQRIADLAPEQRERMIEVSTRFAGVVAYPGAVLGRPVTILIAAAVFLFVFNLLLGARITYRQAVAVTSYAFLTFVLSTILSIVTLYLKSPEDFDLRNPIAFNAGYFLSPNSTPKWLFSMAGSADAFSFWTLALLATGFAICAKMSWGKALIAVAVPWLLWVALSAARAELFT